MNPNHTNTGLEAKITYWFGYMIWRTECGR